MLGVDFVVGVVVCVENYLPICGAVMFGWLSSEQFMALAVFYLSIGFIVYFVAKNTKPPEK